MMSPLALGRRSTRTVHVLLALASVWWFQHPMDDRLVECPWPSSLPCACTAQVPLPPQQVLKLTSNLVRILVTT